MTLIKEICNTFNKQAVSYERAAKVQHEIGQRLFERLSYLKITPRYVLDLGCGPSIFTRLLKKKYPKAHIIGLDIAYAMLLEAKKKQIFWRPWFLVNGDMTHLPFASGLFDLIFANQVIHWSPSLIEVLRELNRVMNVNGCLMFSTLGPDTFKEIKEAWKKVDSHDHINAFMDMHDVGDALLKEHFIDPVVDMEMLTVHYKTLTQLLSNLKAQGVRNIHTNRNKGLTGRHAWQQFENTYKTCFATSQQCPLSYEVIYGHAWKGKRHYTARGVETLVPISQIPVKSDGII